MNGGAQTRDSNDDDLVLYLGAAAWFAASGDKTWVGAPELSANTGPSPVPVEIQRFLGGDWIAADGRMVPVAGALAGVLDELLGALGRTAPVGHAVVAYPTRWGGPTRRVVETAIRARSIDATFVPAAVAAATAYTRRAEVSSGFHRLAVLEVDTLDVTVTVLDGVVPGSWRIDSCTHEPAVGLGDVEFVDTAVRLIHDLIGARALDAVLVLGRLGVGDLDRLGSVDGRSLPGPLRELDGPELVAALPYSGTAESGWAGESGAASESGAAAESADPADRVSPLGPVTRLAPARWLDADSGVPLGRRRPDRVRVSVAAAVAVLVVAAVVVFWIRSAGVPHAALGADPDVSGSAATVGETVGDSTKLGSTAGSTGPSPSGPPISSSAVAAPPTVTSITAAGLRFQLPPGWQRRDNPAGGRQELIPASGTERRIILVRKDLVPGAGIEQVAAQLADRLAAAGDSRTVGGLRRDHEFGGRSSLAYSEFPGDESQVDWHVLVDRDTQVSIGCQYLPGDASAWMADCARVVGTVEVLPRS